ncbi:MAG: heme exporter protein CcmB [Acidimicrobiales bacterium]
MLRDAWLVCRKDLRIERRSRVTFHHVLPFVLTVVMLFAFALDANSAILRRASSGLFWVTVLFAANIVTQRVSAVDRADGIGDAMRLSSLQPAGVFLGKALALFVQLTLTEVVLAVLMLVSYDVRVSGVALILASIPLGTVAVAAVGAIYGPLAAGLGGKESVLPLLMLPALAPVLLAATSAFGVAFGTTVGPGWRWVAMLGMLSAIYVVVGMATSAALLEEA